MGIAKSMLIEVLKTQNPKVILIDINGILYNDDFETREGPLRSWIDNMPYSENKVQTIQELVPEDERLSYYIPFLSAFCAFVWIYSLIFVRRLFL